jgi:uncharacterized SAM-binding protein YcdF (DUF218 family)
MAFDAVIVLSGGLTKEGLPSENVIARLDTAVPYIHDSQYVILNSRGTPHKPPVLDSTGFPIDESEASARYLVENHGIDPSKILLDSWSKDTIGNAYFALVNLCIPRNMEKIMIVTSGFHMSRSVVIFDHIFGLATRPMKISYVSSPDVGLTTDSLAARTEKEKQSAQKYMDNVRPIVTDMRTLNEFIFSKHDAYRYNRWSPSKGADPAPSGAILDSY